MAEDNEIILRLRAFERCLTHAKWPIVPRAYKVTRNINDSPVHAKLPLPEVDFIIIL